MRLLKRFLKLVAAIVLVPFLLFEEWGWEPLAAALRRLSRLPFWARLEVLISRLPPWAALLAFGLPMVALLPIKLLALFLFSAGHATLGLILLIAAKISGTALLAWLFQLTQPQLMKLRWFAYWYPRWKAWKDQLLDMVRASAPWQAARRAKCGAKRAWRTRWRMRCRSAWQSVKAAFGS